MGKKRIGIISILRVDNYGAELQSYATQEVMNRMGYEAEIIDYIFYKNPLHSKEKVSYPFYPYPLKNRLKEWANLVLSKVNQLRHIEAEKERRSRFDAFHSSYNRFSPKQYKRYSELYANPPEYDAYCVGSDQVWNPRCYTNLSPYFLTFAPKDAIKFSYASSFGVSSLPASAKSQYAQCLENLSLISVREPDGVRIVRELTGREAQHVADPTLLLSSQEWQIVQKPVEGLPDKYVLVYELHPLQSIMDLAQRIASENGCKVVRLCKATSDTREAENVVNVVSAGPSEFVYLFLHAAAVVTNSFHGTAFSINFKKDFYCVISRKLTNNSRQLGLLSMCGLLDRVVYDQEAMPSLASLKIDYAEASAKLNVFVEKSKQYIKRAIDGE